MFSKSELLDTRNEFRLLSKHERNCIILGQLRSFQRISDQAKSARASKDRQRQKFEYRINADRHACRETFLFYYGSSTSSQRNHSSKAKNIQRRIK